MNGFVGTPTYCGRPSGRSPRHLLATMPRSGCSDFAVEVGSAAVGVLPVSTSMEPSLCDDIVWCKDRTTASLSAIRACIGKSSQKAIPGTAVLIGRNGPRISAGASGLGSNVSNWLGPPHIQNRMTDVGREICFALAAMTCGTVRLPRVTPPRRSSARREIVAGCETSFMAHSFLGTKRNLMANVEHTLQSTRIHIFSEHFPRQEGKPKFDQMPKALQEQ